MGAFDLPAALTYVRSKTTSKKKLFYIGHSMGTMMFWVAINEHQALMEDSVELMVAMGPVATVKHIESPVRILAPVSKEVNVSLQGPRADVTLRLPICFYIFSQFIFHILGVNEFAPPNWIIRAFEKVACDPTMEQRKLCSNILFLLTGYDQQQENSSPKTSHYKFTF